MKLQQFLPQTERAPLAVPQMGALFSWPRFLSVLSFMSPLHFPLHFTGGVAVQHLELVQLFLQHLLLLRLDVAPCGGLAPTRGPKWPIVSRLLLAFKSPLPSYQVTRLQEKSAAETN